MIFESISKDFLTRHHSLLSGSGNEYIASRLLEERSLVCSELGSGDLDGLLFFGLNTSSNQFEHLPLKWGESGNFSDELSNEECSFGLLSLKVDWSLLPFHFSWSVNEMSFV